jgi:aspartate/methionine/tyrosine aminotransferase
MNKMNEPTAGLKVAQRSNVEPFRAMEVVARAAALAAEGRDIISMCVGQPFAPAPAAAREAAARAIADGRIGYTQSPGIPALRTRIADFYAERHGAPTDPERVFVTTGSSAGFILAFLACFDPGDRVAIPSPGYPAYRNILRALSLEPVEIATRREDRWVVTPSTLQDHHLSKPLAGLLVANPNNPNGTMMPVDAFNALNEKCRELSIRFISDEIYHGLTYGIEESTALAVDEQAVVINSFSKFFCMTGWRIGWMVVPENLVEPIARLQQNAFICAPEVSQVAALASFAGIDEMLAVKEGYQRNRELFLRRLPQLGVTEIQPIDGAFYAYCNVSELAADSTSFAASLLDEAGVAVTPGQDFDSARGSHWVRLSFCGDYGRLDTGFDRIAAWLQENRRG